MIILGSSSPRRIELIKELGFNYQIIKPNFDEKSINLNPSINYSLILARKKLDSLLNDSSLNIDYQNDLIITFDTSIYFNNKIYNKPNSKNEAYSFLNDFSFSTHQVITGFAIYYKNQIIEEKDITDVTFNKLNERQILDYIEKENVYDKAGSYALQDDQKFHLIHEIKGSYYNVIGFPLEKIKDILFNKLNYKDTSV